jgi:hypothetical protein
MKEPIREVQYFQQKLMEELEYFNYAVMAGISIGDMDRLYERLKRINKQLMLVEDSLIIDRLMRGED